MTEETKAVATTGNNTEIISEVPDLEKHEVASMDLVAEYWSPEAEGETRRMIFYGVEKRMVQDYNTKQPKEIDCAVFVEQHRGLTRLVINGSARLIGVFENGGVDRGTPVEVTFVGKKKNKTNQNLSNDWSVVLLKAASKAESEVAS